MDITVVIPTLNEEKYIRRCIESLRNQTRKCQIIVVDSGSDDKTRIIAARHADLVLRGQRNIAYNRQIGAENAYGSIVVTTDADCFHPADWLENICGHFDDSDVVCVSGPTMPIPEEGNVLDRFCYESTNYLLKVLNDVFKKALFRGSNTAYRKDAFFRAGGYNTRLRSREDSDITMRISKIGKTVFDMDALVYTSMRRRKKLGWLKTIRYYLDTPISMITGKQYYEEAR